jgi:glycosyltransferase involved in cell wall biosynthesis
MASDSPAGDAEPRDLLVQLEAERAAVEHWRRVALQRSEEFAALRSRPSVRALLRMERHLRPMAGRVRSARRRLGAAGERLALSAAALRRVGRRRSPTKRGIASPPIASSPPPRRLSVVLVGTGEPRWLADLPPSVSVTRAPEADAVPAALALAIEAGAPDVVGVVAATTEPANSDWLERLVAAMDGTVVAAAPLLVHPCRPVRLATAHDGLVRAAGVGLRLSEGGVPQAVALAAGTRPRPEDGFVDVDAGSGAMLLVDRAAYEGAGGLAPNEDLDAAAVELCARLRARGGRVVLVPTAVAVDHRLVRTRRSLRFAADPTGPGWAAAIDRSGAVLRRAADGRPDPPGRFVVTVAAPSAKVAARWGDWHLAQSLAESLRRLGTEARVQTADHADDLGGRSSDVHLVIRGLQPVRRTPGQRHALWIISHPEAIDDDELDAADLVLVASSRFADHLRRRTSTPVEVMLQATDHRRFRPRPVDPSHRHDVTIVAKSRDVLRPVVLDALAAGLRPAIYGGGWRGLVDPELVVADHVDNEVLPVVYSSAGVVLADHWRTMRAWGFVSNRVYDVVACGTPVISDPVDGLDDLFDGAVLQYRTPDELRRLVDVVLADREGARQQAGRARRNILANHTFDHRAHQLLDRLGGDYGPASGSDARSASASTPPA